MKKVIEWKKKWFREKKLKLRLVRLKELNRLNLNN